MRWAESLFESRSAEDPTRALTASDYNAYFKYGDRASGSGVPVTEQSAMGLTGYLRAISLIAGSVAGLPIRVYYRDTRTRVAQRTVLDSPSDTQTPFEFWQTWEMQRLSWGNAYGFKIRDRAGVTRKVDIVHPSRVKCEVENRVKVFEVQGEDGARPRQYTSFDMAHLPFLSPDGVSGLSPLQACRTVLGGALAAEKVTESFYRNGTKLSGILSTESSLTKPQADGLKSRWRELFAGPQRAGEVAVLDAGAKFTPLTLPPEDAQLLQSRAFSVTEIARMFGVPSHFLNDQEKATAWGSGIESMGIGYVVYTLLPRLKSIEQRITRELLPGGWESGAWEARIDVKGLLRGDAAGRAAFYGALMDRRVMTNHDVAALEDMDPPAGPPVFVMPSNYAMVGEDGEVQALTAPPSAPEPPAGPQGNGADAADAVVRWLDEVIEERYSSTQPRRPNGQWGSGGVGGAPPPPSAAAQAAYAAGGAGGAPPPPSAAAQAAFAGTSGSGAPPPPPPPTAAVQAVHRPPPPPPPPPPAPVAAVSATASGKGRVLTSPEESKQFIDEEYGEWKAGLSDGEDRAIRFYQSPGFELMNKKLRGQPVDAPATDMKRASDAIDGLNSAISKAPPLKAPLTVFRGMSAQHFGTELSPGAMVSDKGFVSTALYKKGVSSVAAKGSQVTAEIRLPAGTKAAAGTTRELILPPGAKFKVLSKKGSSVVLEYVP